MKTTPYPPPWLKMPVLLLFMSMVLASSCKLLQPQTPKETAFLEPELLQLAQEIKTVERTKAFYARLDEFSAKPQLKGSELASELNLLRKDLKEIQRVRDELSGIEKQMWKLCPVCGAVLPPKPPPPPPPPIIEGDILRVSIPRSKPLVVYLRPQTTSISITQDNTVVQPASITTLEGGYKRAVFDVSSFNNGPAFMQIGGANEVPANIPMSMIK